MFVEREKLVKSLKIFFCRYYNMLFNEKKVFDIKIWVLLSEMGFLRDHKGHRYMKFYIYLKLQ